MIRCEKSLTSKSQGKKKTATRDPLHISEGDSWYWGIQFIRAVSTQADVQNQYDMLKADSQLVWSSWHK